MAKLRFLPPFIVETVRAKPPAAAVCNQTPEAGWLMPPIVPSSHLSAEQCAEHDVGLMPYLFDLESADTIAPRVQDEGERGHWLTCRRSYRCRCIPSHCSHRLGHRRRRRHRSRWKAPRCWQPNNPRQSSPNNLTIRNLR
jgi:hypothetical protein